MNTEQIILSDIADNPADDSLRLILADWLEDHGQESRAEFVRAMCWQAEDELELKRLQLRALQLLEQHQVAWLGSIPAERVLWDRGTILLRIEDVEACQNDPAFAWVTGFAYHLKSPPLGKIAEILRSCPRLSHVVDLRLNHNFLEDAHIDKIFANLLLPRLQHLQLFSASFTKSALRAVQSYPWFSQLCSLSITNVPPADIPLRARSSPVPGSLSPGLLFRMTPSPARCRLLIESGGLGLGRNLQMPGHRLSDADIIVLANCDFLQRVERLNLNDNEIGSPGACALASSPHLSSLTRLELQNNPIDDDGIRALAEATFPKLEYLNISGYSFSLVGLEALRRSPLWGHLPHPVAASNADWGDDFLEVRCAEEIGMETIRIIARAEGLKQLLLLGDGLTKMTAQEMCWLCESQTLQELRVLRLERLGITDELLEILVTSPIVRSVSTLSLAANEITATGVRSIAEAEMGWLRKVDLRDNPGQEEGETIFGERYRLGNSQTRGLLRIEKPRRR
jgi:uncharacterized protein (TIGR02996 family)